MLWAKGQRRYHADLLMYRTKKWSTLEAWGMRLSKRIVMKNAKVTGP